MITKNPMQLKAFIKKKAAEKNISAQLVMQNYMLERLLERRGAAERYNLERAVTVVVAAFAILKTA